MFCSIIIIYYKICCNILENFLIFPKVFCCSGVHSRIYFNHKKKKGKEITIFDATDISALDLITAKIALEA